MNKNSRRLYEDCFRYEKKKKELTDKTLKEMFKKPELNVQKRRAITPHRGQDQDIKPAIEFRPATQTARSVTPNKPPSRKPAVPRAAPQARLVPVFREGATPAKSGLEIERVNVIKVPSSEVWQLDGLQRWLENTSDHLRQKSKK